MTAESNELDAFESILEKIGNDGAFQKRANLIFNFALCIVVAMSYMNYILAVAVPEHWCHVPGRELTNFTLDEWKNFTLPKENNTKGELVPSSCKMYNDSNDLEEIVPCKYGWEFNTTYYHMTAAMQHGWVCDNELYVTNAIMVARIGEVIGAFMFGQLADIAGRLPVFYVSLITLMVGRMANIFTGQWIILFYVVTCIGYFPSMNVFQGPLVITMEISKPTNRALISMLQCIGWTVGLCIMPLIMWVVRDWVPFLALTTLPAVIFLCLGRFIVESPRWLASKGKTKQCVRELKKIAKDNGREVPKNIESTLEKLHETYGETAYGVVSLFSNWRLAKNTLIILFNWSTTILVYFTFTLSIENLEGNPFINFFLQGLAEFPAYIVGKFISDRFGRRYSAIASFFVTLKACLALTYFIRKKANMYISIGITIFIKFSVSVAFYAVNLQAMEIYPTCLRQTGLSLGGVVANLLTIISPYLIYWGETINALIPAAVCSVFCIIGVILGAFLPETLGQQLPETLKEAQTFGADQTFSGKRKILIIRDDDAEKPLKSPIN